MTYSEVIYLISKTYTHASGITTATEEKEKVYASLNNVGTREFYNAAGAGIKPEYEFQTFKNNYDGQDEVEYLGIRYDVIRAIWKDFDVVLVVGRKALNKS